MCVVICNGENQFYYSKSPPVGGLLAYQGKGGTYNVEIGKVRGNVYATAGEHDG